MGFDGMGRSGRRVKLPYEGIKSLGAFLLVVWGSLSLNACHPASGSRVVLKGQGDREISVQVEIADTPERRTMGLQYRTDLEANQGMLFLFPQEKIQTFWMKNTPIPLDLIFIGKQRRIVGIVHESVPYSTASLSVATPSQFVLEVNGGFARTHGIEVGQAVRFESFRLPEDGI